MIQIIEYEDKYLEDVRNLLVEQEEYIVLIDKDNLDTLHPEYRKKMALVDLENVKKNNGRCFLAKEENRIVGLIMGVITRYSKVDYLDYKCPKRGEITELAVTKDYRNLGIGKQLIKKIEEYFLDEDCKYSLIPEIFAYNDKAIRFYEKNGYHTRMIAKIKKL